MKTIKHVLTILLLLACTAAAADGFFRPQLAGPPDEPALDAGPKESGFQCAIQVRYNSPAPTSLELTYIGGSSCSAEQEQAISAASAANKASVNGEAANAPVYQCAVMVAWNAGGASQPDVASTGAGCDATRPTALRAAVPAVACIHRELVACRP
jgi:hypothetical protein